MPRGLTSAQKAALASGAKFARLLHFEFSPAIRITDAARNLVAGGETFTRSDHILRTDPAVETGKLRVNKATVTLSNVDKIFAGVFLSQSRVNAKLRRSIALLGSDGVTLIDDPIEIFYGSIEQVKARIGGGRSEIMVSVASHWADFDRKNGRKTNHNSQTALFPGDLGLQYAGVTIKNVPWGGHT